MGSSASFHLTLSLAAPVAQLEGWLESAPPRAEAIYAAGVDFPRDEPAVALVRGWHDQGLVTLTQRRDAAKRRTEWIVIKAADNDCGIAAGDHAGGEETREASPIWRQKRDLLAWLVARYGTARGNPSYRSMAEALDLPDPRGRGLQRARYVLRQLEIGRLVKVTNTRPRGPIAVIVTDAGRMKVKVGKR